MDQDQKKYRRVVVAGKVTKASFKLRPAGGEGVSQGNSILGRRNSQCKGPEAELRPVWLWSSSEWEKMRSEGGRARSLGLVGLSEGLRFCSKHACGWTQ